MSQFRIGDKVILKGGLRSPIRYNEELFEYMGTVREVIDIDDSPYGPRIKLAGCIDIRGNSIIFWPEDLLPVPEPGDKVKIRSWEDMEDQYGLDNDRNINVNGFSIVKSMKEYCGEIIPVSFVDEYGIVGFEEWDFFPFCFEEVYKKGGSEIKKKVLTISQAVEILRDKFECAVKIVEDDDQLRGE